MCKSHPPKTINKFKTIVHYWKMIHWKAGLLLVVTGKRLIGTDVGLSLIIRDKRAKNSSGWHHAPKCHRFQDIRVQFITVRPILKNCFPSIFFIFIHTFLRSFIGSQEYKNMYSWILMSSQEITSTKLYIIRRLP